MEDNEKKLANIFYDALNEKKYQNKKSNRIFAIIISILLVALILIMVQSYVFTAHVMTELNATRQDFMELLSTLEYSETTTTEVVQDTGEGEGNNVFQSGENALYNENGGE